MKTFFCLNCNKESKWTHSSYNKYCSNRCQSDFVFKNETLLRFHSGKITERNTIRRCLSETVGYECAICKLKDWQGMPITLQVSHINGDPSNNSPSNLQLICPNCHSQTDSFGGKNKGKGRKARGLPTR